MANLLTETRNHLLANPDLIWKGNTIMVGRVEEEAEKFARACLNSNQKMVDSLTKNLFIDDSLEEKGEEINEDNRIDEIAMHIACKIDWRFFADKGPLHAY